MEEEEEEESQGERRGDGGGGQQRRRGETEWHRKRRREKKRNIQEKTGGGAKGIQRRSDTNVTWLNDEPNRESQLLDRVVSKKKGEPARELRVIENDVVRSVATEGSFEGARLVREENLITTSVDTREARERRITRPPSWAKDYIVGNRGRTG